MDRQDQRAGFGNAKIVFVDRHALAFQLLDLLAQMPGIEHHAIANDRQRAADDAGGEQRKLVDRTVDDQRMTSVMATLKANHDIGAFGQPVDNLALAFVPPLRTDYRYIGHKVSFL